VTISRYRGLIKYICKNGHTKYCQPYLRIDICNICGTKEFILADKNQKICANHLHRPAVRVGMMIDGVGDCTVCIPDEDNIKCKNYVPITISVIEVKE